jgi:hypothetical protein
MRWLLLAVVCAQALFVHYAYGHRRVDKKHGYIVCARELILFVPCDVTHAHADFLTDTTLARAVQLNGNIYSARQLQKLMRWQQKIGERMHCADVKSDTIDVVRCTTKYRLLEHIPKRFHEGGNFNLVFYADTNLIRTDYDEESYRFYSLLYR